MLAKAAFAGSCRRLLDDMWYVHDMRRIPKLAIHLTCRQFEMPASEALLAHIRNPVPICPICLHSTQGDAHMYAVTVAVKLFEICAQSAQAQKPPPRQNNMQSRHSRVAYSKYCLSANKLSCQVGSSTHRHVLLLCMQLLHAVAAVVLQQQCNSEQITGPSKTSFLTYPGILRVQLAAVWLGWINVEAREQAEHCCEQARVVVEEHR